MSWTTTEHQNSLGSVIVIVIIIFIVRMPDMSLPSTD